MNPQGNEPNPYEPPQQQSEPGSFDEPKRKVSAVWYSAWMWVFSIGGAVIFWAIAPKVGGGREWGLVFLVVGWLFGMFVHRVISIVSYW